MVLLWMDLVSLMGSVTSTVAFWGVCELIKALGDLYINGWNFLFFHFSSAISKHWEAELATLKGNNAKLTAALLESTANVKQWKQQLAAYQEEAERLHKRVSAGLLT